MSLMSEVRIILVHFSSKSRIGISFISDSAKLIKTFLDYLRLLNLDQRKVLVRYQGLEISIWAYIFLLLITNYS